MKVFKGFNQVGKPCPVCNTMEDKVCVLVPIAGTNIEEDGHEGLNYQAEAIHLDCIDLIWDPRVMNENEEKIQILMYQIVELPKAS